MWQNMNRFIRKAAKQLASNPSRWIVSTGLGIIVFVVWLVLGWKYLDPKASVYFPFLFYAGLGSLLVFLVTIEYSIRKTTNGAVATGAAVFALLVPMYYLYEYSESNPVAALPPPVAPPPGAVVPPGGAAVPVAPTPIDLTDKKGAWKELGAWLKDSEVIIPGEGAWQWGFVGALPPRTAAPAFEPPNPGVARVTVDRVPGSVAGGAVLVSGTAYSQPLSQTKIAELLEERRGKESGDALALDLPFNDTLPNPGKRVVLLFGQMKSGAARLTATQVTPRASQWIVKLDGPECASFSIPPGFKHLWVVPIRDERYLSQIHPVVIPPEGWGATGEEVKEVVKNLAAKAHMSPAATATLQRNEEELFNRAPMNGKRIPYRAMYMSVDGAHHQVLSAEDGTYTATGLRGSIVTLGLNMPDDDSSLTQFAHILVGVSWGE